MLGVTTEVSVKPLEAGRVESVVTSHYENGTQESTRFVLSFEPNTDPGSAFACRLTEITPPPPGAETVGELTFTWDELIEANRLRNVFKIYPTVRHFCREHNPEMVTWVYPRGEDLTILTLSDGYASGCFRRASFTWQEREGEGWLASIEEFTERESFAGLTEAAGEAARRYETLYQHFIAGRAGLLADEVRRTLAERGEE